MFIFVWGLDLFWLGAMTMFAVLCVLVSLLSCFFFTLSCFFLDRVDGF